MARGASAPFLGPRSPGVQTGALGIIGFGGALGAHSANGAPFSPSGEDVVPRSRRLRWTGAPVVPEVDAYV